MHRKTVKEQTRSLRDYADDGLRSRCLRFVRDHQSEIKTNKPAIPDGLSDRAADVWEPLFVLADVAGGPWPETSRNASGACQAAPDQSSPISTLLCDIWITFQSKKAKRLFTREIITALERFGDRPYRPASHKPLTGAWPSRILSRYGVTPRSLWKNGIVGRGYEQQDLHELFRRYMSKADVMDYVNEMKKVNAEREAHPEAPLATSELHKVRAQLQKMLGLTLAGIAPTATLPEHSE